MRLKQSRLLRFLQKNNHKELHDIFSHFLISKITIDASRHKRGY